MKIGFSFHLLHSLTSGRYQTVKNVSSTGYGAVTVFEQLSESSTVDSFTTSSAALHEIDAVLHNLRRHWNIGTRRQWPSHWLRTLSLVHSLPLFHTAFLAHRRLSFFFFHHHLILLLLAFSFSLSIATLLALCFAFDNGDHILAAMKTAVAPSKSLASDRSRGTYADTDSDGHRTDSGSSGQV